MATLETALESFYKKNATDNHTIVTPLELCYNILSQVDDLSGSILVIANVEWISTLVRDFNIDPTDITFVTPCDNKAKLARKVFPLITTIHHNILEKELNMKFDVVVGNPPYQDGNNKTLYKSFVTKAHSLSDVVAMVVPSAHFRKKSALDNVAVYSNIGNPFYKVTLSMSYFISNKGSTSIKFIGEDGEVILDRNKVKVVPGKSVMGWKDSIELIAEDGKGLTFNSGKLKRREEREVHGPDIVCILSTGKRGKEFDTCSVHKDYKHLLGGLGEHKVVFGADYTLGDIGPIKYADPSMGCSARAFYITASSKKEANMIIDYLESDEVKQLVANIKTMTAKNSKSLFNMIRDPRL